MKVQGMLGPSFMAASVLAGPVFLTSSALAAAYLTLPKVIAPEMRAEDMIPVAGALLLSGLIGALIAFPANAIGSSILVALSTRFAWMRMPLVWALVGCTIGAGTAAGLFEPAIAFGLSIASAFSAWMCRRDLVWAVDA